MALAETLDQRRRAWAEEQIGNVRRQIDGLNRKIEELQAFIRLLDSTSKTFSSGAQAELPSIDTPRLNGAPLSEYIQRVLAGVGSHGMRARDVARQVEALGFKRKPGVKVSLTNRVTAELGRLSKRGSKGVTSLGNGRYALNMEIGV